jgi:hypothetical protein
VAAHSARWDTDSGHLDTHSSVSASIEGIAYRSSEMRSSIQQPDSALEEAQKVEVRL